MPEDACQSKNYFLDILSEANHYLLKKSHPESLFSIKNQYLCLYMKIQYYN